MHSVRGKAKARRAIARPRGGVFALAKTAVSDINNRGRLRLRQGQGPPGDSPPPRRRFCASKNCRERYKQLRTLASEARPTGRRAYARPRGGVFALAKTAVSDINNCGRLRLRQGQRPPGESPHPRRRFCVSKNCRERNKYPPSWKINYRVGSGSSPR